ncbi:MAG: right-handed parallel beta-helix repeat-containing protein, partial [Terrimicrobiaceae bacterium]
PDPNGFGIGFQNRATAEGVRTGITVTGCSVYQNLRYGIAIRGCRDATVKNCLVADNSYGFAISQSRNVLVEENEIAWNLNDGLLVTWDTEDVVVKKNAIHHHSRFAHPDNFQTYRGVKNVLLDSNVLVASGQGAHTQQTVDLTARNNIFAGTSANVFFTSGPDTKNTGTEKEGGGYVLENNTFALFANGAVIIKGPGHKMTGNIFAVQGGKYAYGSDEPSSGVTSKNNRFWISDSSHGILASFKEGRSIRFTNLEDLQTQTGLEEGSDLVDPAFPNAPVRVAGLDGKKISLCTESRLFYEGTDAFKTGDHVEFDFDGVDRVVRDADGESIVIDPPLASAPVTTVLLANWGTKPVGKIDLRTKDKRGSTVNFEAYMRGDFNDDGQRDVPAWPAGITSPRKTL